MQFVSKEDVQRVLTYELLIPKMESALQKFSDGKVDQPVRTVIDVKEAKGFLGVMPAYSEYHSTLATKLVGFYPHNKGVPTHNAIIVLFDTQTGVPELVMDGEVITAMRTAAVSAIATKYLCKKDPQVLAILGSGVQARSHYRALSGMYKFSLVRVWSRTPAHAQKFAEETGAVVCDSAQSAVQDADIVVTVTSSPTPILQHKWVKPGAHINAVGACRPDMQELDPDLVTSSVLYVDSREAALKESGDVILSKAEIYAELGEVIAEKKEVNRNKTTVFKSLGMAVEDALSAKLVKDLLTCEITERR